MSAFGEEEVFLICLPWVWAGLIVLGWGSFSPPSCIHGPWPSLAGGERSKVRPKHQVLSKS